MSNPQASWEADLQSLYAYQLHKKRHDAQEHAADKIDAAYAAALDNLRAAHAMLVLAEQERASPETLHAVCAAWLRAKELAAVARALAADAPCSTTFHDIIDQACAEDAQFRAQFDALDPDATRAALSAAQADVAALIRSVDARMGAPGPGLQ